MLLNFIKFKKYSDAINTFFCFFIIILISICTFKVINTHSIPNNDFSIKVTLSVLNGDPDWIAFQNRLLGPYIILLISKFGFSVMTSWKIFTSFFILLQNFILFNIFIKEKKSTQESITGLIIFSFFFLVMQHYCFYPWDSIDLIIFTLFSYWIIKERHINYFILLFFVSIFNRETALFLPLYLIISSLNLEKKKPYLHCLNFKKLCIGITLFVSGVIYIKSVRYILFNINSETHLDNLNLIGNRIHFFENLNYIFIKNILSTNIIFSTFIIFSLIFFSFFIKKLNRGYLNCYLIFFLISLNIIIFGYFNESRMLLILIPFVIFLYLFIQRSILRF